MFTLTTAAAAATPQGGVTNANPIAAGTLAMQMVSEKDTSNEAKASEDNASHQALV